MFQSATVESTPASVALPEPDLEPYSVGVASGREWEREIDALRRRQQLAWKRAIWALKEELEASAGRGGRSAR